MPPPTSGIRRSVGKRYSASTKCRTAVRGRSFQPTDHLCLELAVSPISSTRCTPTGLPSICAESAGPGSPEAQLWHQIARNRHCPMCQGAAATGWLAAREADLLPVAYFHVVFTLPAAIAAIAYQNKAAIYDILFTASAETMIAIAADPKHLGARIAITAVLHTWGSAMTHHPHVHMIVPGGGISADGSRWVSCRSSFFLPVQVLSRLFRGLFLAKLRAAHRAGRLNFFGNHAHLDDARAFKAYLAPLHKAEWVVYAKRPCALDLGRIAPAERAQLQQAGSPGGSRRAHHASARTLRCGGRAAPDWRSRCDTTCDPTPTAPCAA